MMLPIRKRKRMDRDRDRRSESRNATAAAKSLFPTIVVLFLAVTMGRHFESLDLRVAGVHAFGIESNRRGGNSNNNHFLCASKTKLRGDSIGRCPSSVSQTTAMAAGIFCGGKNLASTARSISVKRQLSSALFSSNRDDESDSDSNSEKGEAGPLLRFADATKQRLIKAALPSLTVVWWPLFAAVGIPALVSYARSFPPNSSQQFAAVTVLIVSNRIYLYALGLTIVATSAFRGLGDPNELGKRLTQLTEELLVLDKPLVVAAENAEAEVESVEIETTTAMVVEKNKTKNNIETVSETSLKLVEPPQAPSFVKKMLDDSGLEENLDGVDANTQALVLPVLVAGLLAISVVSLPIWSSLTEGFSSLPSSDGVEAEWITLLKSAASELLKFTSQAWNAILLTLFVRAEIRRLGYELTGIGGPSTPQPVSASIAAASEVTDEIEEQQPNTVPKAQIVAECLLAVAVTIYGAYIVQYWPAQNYVNSAIAILVARAIRLDSFYAVFGALALLTIYDGASVLLIPGAANAATAMTGSGDFPIETATALASSSTPASLTIAASNPASSAMGSVAMQKLTADGFQPGLLVTKLDGDKLTGGLGLGDAVFPSILASFLKRFDEDSNKGNASSNEKKSRLFEASLGGYVIGCLACEFAPTIATRGVPALVFIVPLMGLVTVLTAVQDGRFEDLRRYNNNEK